MNVPLRRESRKPVSRLCRAALYALPFGVVLVIAALELLLPPRFTPLPLLITVPGFGALYRSSNRVLLLGATTLLAALAASLAAWPARSPSIVATLLAITAVTTLTWYWVKVFARQERTLADVRAISDTAQQVILPPVPRLIGNLRAEVRYLAAGRGSAAMSTT